VNPDRVLTIISSITKTGPHTIAMLNALPTGDAPFALLPISETNFIRRDSQLKYNFVRPEGSSTGDYQLQVVGQEGTLQTKRLTEDMLVPFEMLLAGKIPEAIDGYRKIKRETPQNVTIREERINNLGYSLLQEGKLVEATALLKLNVEFYPDAWNTYDSLGEAYMKAGQKDLAISNYKKSLKLNPQNSNAREMLKKLEQ